MFFMSSNLFRLREEARKAWDYSVDLPDSHYLWHKDGGKTKTLPHKHWAWTRFRGQGHSSGVNSHLKRWYSS